MDIGGLQDNYHKGKGGKGRDQKGGKGKDHKGKFKGEHNKSGKNNWHSRRLAEGGKGQYYQQYQKQDKGKGKGQNAKGKQHNGKGKGNVSNPHAGKQCHVCKKHGHIAADCWWKVGSVENAEQIDPDNKGSTGGSGGVGAIAGDVILTINNVQQHVSACSSDPSHVSLLVDSGACESVARKGEFESPVDSRLAKPLFSVQGTPLQVYGKQYPEVQVGSMRGQVEMTVTDAAESLVSVHSLVSKGYDVNFSSQGCFVDTGHGKVPLEMHGKRWYLKVEKRPRGEHRLATRRVAPVAPDPDRWKIEQVSGRRFMVRVHNMHRRQLFNPVLTNCPVSVDGLFDHRVTYRTFTNAERDTVEDRWVDRGSGKASEVHWQGETSFEIRPEVDMDAERVSQEENAAQAARRRKQAER